MTTAPCPHCGRNRVVVSAGTPQARLRSHTTQDADGARITCPGSLQPPTSTKET